MALPPDGVAVGVATTTSGQGTTVTTTAPLSAAGAHAPLTRTQYEVVDVGLTVRFLLLPAGCDVFPTAPMYH
jgi:hypothetical protein